MLDEPTRHGRAADALIASYLRELLADEPTEPTGGAASDLAREPEVPLSLLAASSDELRTDATL
jgi:hypothetical protein